MEVKFKKLTPQAFIPQASTEEAAGYDLRIPETVTIHLGRQVIPLGFAIQLPRGYKADIDPRSGFSSKGMEGFCSVIDMTENRPSRFDSDVVHGMVDSDYTGGVGVIINNRSGYEFILKRGSRIAQMVIVKHETVTFTEVEELEQTERGTGGFGHTGTM